MGGGGVGSGSYSKLCYVSFEVEYCMLFFLLLGFGCCFTPVPSYGEAQFVRRTLPKAPESLYGMDEYYLNPQHTHPLSLSLYPFLGGRYCFGCLTFIPAVLSR